MLTMIALPLLYAILDDVVGFKFRPFRLIRKKAIPILLILLLPAFASQAQTKAISLDEALEMALENNLEYKVSELQFDEQKALIKAANSIDKTAIYYEYDQNNIADNGYALGVWGIEQRFDFPTVYGARKKVAKLNSDVAGKELEQQKKVLSKEVSQAFYTVLYLKEKQLKIQFVDSIYNRYSKAAESSYKYGEISRLELLNAKSKHSQLELQKKQIENELAIAKQQLNTLIQGETEFTAFNGQLTKLSPKSADVQIDPMYQALNISVDKQKAQHKLSKNSLLPDLNVGYFNGTNQFAGAKRYYGFQLGIAVPLFFGEQKATIKANQIATETAYTLQEHYKIQFQAKLNSLGTELEQYVDAIKYYENIGKELSYELQEASQKSFSAGEIDFFQLVQSIDNAIQIEMNYLENLARYNRIVIEINYLTL